MSGKEKVSVRIRIPKYTVLQYLDKNGAPMRQEVLQEDRTIKYKVEVDSISESEKSAAYDTMEPRSKRCAN